MNIAEIAKLAGVSPAAVSRYFNNGYISDEKRKAIRRVVEQTGYRPSLQAQTLRTKRTKLIGVIVPRINSGAVGSIVAGVLSVLDAGGYQMLLADTQNAPEKEIEYLTVFDEKQVDGVIFAATVFTPEHRRIMKGMSVPAVVTGQRIAGYNCVYYDDYHAAYDITKLMLGKGKRKLGFISVPHRDAAAGLERFRGYCRAVEDAGLTELAENYVISDFSLKSGYEKMKELMERCGELDGVVCATDTIAVGGMQYLKERGVNLPGQMMIAGHGNSAISDVTTPTLTTVHYSFEESGVLSARILLENIEDKSAAVKEIMMGYRLVEKESTGKPD
ncbi:MAG: LacI family transcriptional regulator [Dorea sp.]|jgi:LacI family sucrose operon transcriptional repressor|nr:LacI family transcriptional regulator [Dorea sp.]